MFVNHNLRAVKCGVTNIALPTTRLRSWVCSQGQLCCLPTRKEKRVWQCSGWTACTWIIQCFQAGWKKNGIYVIQSLVYFLFLPLGGIWIKFSILQNAVGINVLLTLSYTRTGVCAKSTANTFNCWVASFWNTDPQLQKPQLPFTQAETYNRDSLQQAAPF